jgi:hypothetical protein
MFTTHRLLTCVVVLIVVASAVRVWTLSRYYRAMQSLAISPSDLSELRQQLFLDSSHRIDHLVAVADHSRPSDETLPTSWKVAWIAVEDAEVDSDGETIHCTVIVRNAADQLVAIDMSSRMPDSIERAMSVITPQWLGDLDARAMADLPYHQLAHDEIHIGIWDDDAAVFVTAGPDGAPGIVEFDDNRNSLVDDMSELGATGSDDFVVAPGQVGYESAKSGQTLSRLISRGAIVDAPPGAPVELTNSTEVWLDFDRTQPAQNRTIMLRVR